MKRFIHLRYFQEDFAELKGDLRAMFGADVKECVEKLSREIESRHGTDFEHHVRFHVMELVHNMLMDKCTYNARMALYGIVRTAYLDYLETELTGIEERVA